MRRTYPSLNAIIECDSANSDAHDVPTRARRTNATRWNRVVTRTDWNRQPNARIYRAHTWLTDSVLGTVLSMVDYEVPYSDGFVLHQNKAHYDVDVFKPTVTR